MTTTQMLIQMGSQTQHVAPKQPDKTQEANAGREGDSFFQSMLEEKQNETAPQAETTQPQAEYEEPNAEQVQAAAGLFLMPLMPQQILVPQEELAAQPTLPMVDFSAKGVAVVQAPVQNQAQAEAMLSTAKQEQSSPFQQVLPQAAGQQMAQQENGVVLTQPQQTPAEAPVQTVQTNAGQEGDGQEAGAQSGKSTTAQKPLPKAEVTQTQTGPVDEQPLFRQVEAAPVKVGQAVPLDTRAQDFDVQAAKAITNALKKGEQRVELKLSPAHLGNVTVALTRTAEGVLHVVLTAEREHALKLLTEHAGYLGNLLQNNNQSEVRIEVPQSQQGRQPWQEDGQSQQQRQSQSQQQRQSGQQEQENFLQQLRLGLIQTEET